MMKVSVIVALYNAEKTIGRCLDSLLSQSHRDLEVIIIDDGSDDGSGMICRRIAEGDPRVRLFRRRNHGVSATRQFGMEQMSGELMIHLDSDDRVEPLALEAMVREMGRTGVDMLITDFYENNGDYEIYRRQRPSGESGRDVAGEIMMGRLHGSVCNKLIRVDCLRRCGARFPEGTDYCEDALMLCGLLMKEIRVGYMPVAWLHYECGSSSSITRSYDMGKFRQRVRFIETLTRITGKEMEGELDMARLNVKYEAFTHGLMGESEVRNAFGDRDLPLGRFNQSALNKLLYLASLRLDPETGYRVFRLKNSIMGKINKWW